MATNNNINFTVSAKDAFSAPMRGIQATMDRFRKDAATGFGMAAGMNVFGKVTAGMQMMVAQFQDAIRASRDLLEQRTKSDAVFKGSAGIIKQFAANAARSFGLSERAALEATGTMGNLLTAIGNTPAEAARMSLALTRLAADVSSFNNVASSDVLRAFNAALVGEAEPARRLGVNISMARVEALGFAQGLSSAKNQLTDSQKVMLRYQIIMQDTKNAQGDFARTSGNMANSQRILDATMENLDAQMGEFLLGPGTQIIKWATDFIDSINGASSAARGLRDAVAEVHLGETIPTPADMKNLSGYADMLNHIGYQISKNIDQGVFGEGMSMREQIYRRHAATLRVLGISYQDLGQMMHRSQMDLNLSEAETVAAYERQLLSMAQSAEMTAIAITGAGNTAKSAAQQWAEGSQLLRYSGMTMQVATIAFNTTLNDHKKRLEDVYALYGPAGLARMGVDPNKPLLAEAIRLTVDQMDRLVGRAPGVIDLLGVITTGAGDPSAWMRISTGLKLANDQLMLQRRYMAQASKDDEVVGSLAPAHERVALAAERANDAMITGGYRRIDAVRRQTELQIAVEDRLAESRQMRMAFFMRQATKDDALALGAEATAESRGAALVERERIARMRRFMAQASKDDIVIPIKVGDGAAAASEWVSSFRDTIKNNMEAIRDLADDIEWSLSHPRRGEVLTTRLEGRLKETRGMMRRAQKIENDEQRRATIADIQQLRSQIRAQLAALNTMDATVTIDTQTTGSTLGLSTSVARAAAANDRKVRAAGGPTRAGETYLVGERGPEMLVMGNQNGHVIPNHALGAGGGNIVVNVDGERLFQIMNRRMGRAMAMGV